MLAEVWREPGRRVLVVKSFWKEGTYLLRMAGKIGVQELIRCKAKILIS